RAAPGAARAAADELPFFLAVGRALYLLRRAADRRSRPDTKAAALDATLSRITAAVRPPDRDETELLRGGGVVSQYLLLRKYAGRTPDEIARLTGRTPPEVERGLALLAWCL